MSQTKQHAQTTEEYEQQYNEEHQGMVVEDGKLQPRTTALALIPRGPAIVEPVRGMQIDVNADFDAKMEAVATIDALMGDDAVHIDKYLNTIIWAVAVIQHPAKVRNNEGVLEDKTRTVLHVTASLGKEHEVASISFTGMAVANYFEQRIIPVFGINFDRPLPFRVTRVPTRKGFTHNIKLIRSAVYPNAQ